MTETESNPPETATPRKGKPWGLMFFIALAGAALFVVFLPAIIAQTEWRNTIVNAALADDELEADVGGAELGWFSPVKMNELSVQSGDDAFDMRIERIGLENTLLGLLANPTAIGTVEVDRPVTKIVTAEFGAAPPEPKESGDPGTDDAEKKATLTLVLNNGAVQVSRPGETEPVIDLNNVSVTARVQQAAGGRQLSIDPVTVFDRSTLTPEFCDKGLQLVAPTLANAAEVSGKMSFELSEFRVPLDDPGPARMNNELKIVGSVTFHEVESSLKNPVLADVTELVAGLLGRRKPETFRVLDDSRVDFRVQQGRIHHEGLAFMLPEVSQELIIRSSGSVGMDESLDLRLDVGLPSSATASIPVLRKLTAEPIVVFVTGTIDDPQVKLPEGRNMLGEMARRLAPESVRDRVAAEPTSVDGAVNNFLDKIGGAAKGNKVDIESTAGSIIDIIRAAKESKRKKKEEEQRR